MSYAQSHSWPGNVRELRNMVDRCAILSTGVTLERHVEIEDWTPGQHVPDSSSGSYEPVTLEEAERRTILNALEHASGIVEGPDGAARPRHPPQHPSRSNAPATDQACKNLFVGEVRLNRGALR